MKIEFQVDGKPSKKDGSNSMWGKKAEAQNLINLRNAAFIKSEETIKQPLVSRVSLELIIRAPENVLESMGDLDNFITGVCDESEKTCNNNQSRTMLAINLAHNDALILEDLVSMECEKRGWIK